MLQILGWLNRRNLNSAPWRSVGDQVSVDPVDNADVHVRDLEEGGALGFLAPPRSEKPVQAACLSRESKKNRPLRDGLNTSWGLVFDRIGETGFEPAASCSKSERFHESFSGYSQSMTQFWQCFLVMSCQQLLPDILRFAHVLRTLGIARCLCRFAARRRCSPLDQAIS